MSIEKDAASDGKKTLALAGVAVIIVAGAGYVGWGWMQQSAVPDSQYNLNRVANNAPVSAQESRQYRELLKLSNQQGAQAAESEGNSFVASLSESQQMDDTPVIPRVAPAPVTLNTQTDSSQYGTDQQGGLNDEQKQQITNLLTQLNARWQTSDMQLASAFGSEGQDGQSPYSQWAQSVPGLVSSPQQPAPQGTAGTSATTAASLINIPGLSRYPGTIDTAIDSDNPESKVIAVIPAGKLQGAQLAAPNVQLAGDGVIVNFKTLAFKGMTCTIDAYAQDDETQRSSIASDVNHRYVTRIILPALANGIGKVGQLYEDSNTQILTTNSGTVTGRTGSPDSKAVAGVIAGGIGQQTAQVMTQDASRLPVTQVNVDRRQVVSILFMKPVTDKDCTPMPAGENS
ncbi:conjugal transfer protein TraO [Salmonella enterica]|nr:conjugal transfer protein TraO [Salmonella enterica]EGK8577262.1 conjugal transfer protein TraO [Salmonella enterica]EHR3166911.1 conjugal transfer protein TraO [Salmonella enterica]EKE7368053.1 conjugal transfer protein TraO [Salmonella enterica]EKM4713597.1 conjugal transfer protein TraO [Salmonella enterica]